MRQTVFGTLTQLGQRLARDFAGDVCFKNAILYHLTDLFNTYFAVRENSLF